MNIQKTRALCVAVVLFMAPSLSWAAEFDCGVYKKTADGKADRDAKVVDLILEAKDLEDAEAQARLQYPDPAKYDINCRASNE